MKVAKTIVIAVCLLLTAITANAQEQKYELSEAKVAPGFYLAPNGYEYQLPQYGLSMTIPLQSYYKVPYLLKHNAYLNTNDSVVSYCLYKFYLSNSYTDFALFGSYNGNMRYRVAELKSNEEKEFLEEIRKKKDYKSLRSLRTPFATFTHYSALNAAGGRIHGYYYLANSILIELIVTPKNDAELPKYESIIKTLRKVDLKKDLDDYLIMLSTLKSTVVGEKVELDIVKEEEEVEVLYAQELSTPAINPQTSPFAEPAPKNNPTPPANTAVTKNTSELAALLRATHGSRQAEEENIEVVAVTITEPTELVVFKGGYIKPPTVDWHFNVQPQQLSAFNLVIAQQKPVRLIEESLLPIYPFVRRPNVSIEIDEIPHQTIAVINDLMKAFPESANKIERSLLAIKPVVKRPNVSVNVHVTEPKMALGSLSLNASTTTAEKSLVSTIKPVAKRPDVTIDIDTIESPQVATVPANRLTTSADTEKALLALAQVEKRPDVSIDVDMSEAQILLANNTLDIGGSTTAAEKTLLAMVPVEKRPDVAVDIEVPNTPSLTINENIDLKTSSAVEKALISDIAPMLKQPEVPVLLAEEAEATAVITDTNSLLASNTNAGQSLLAIAEVKKQPVSSNDRADNTIENTADNSVSIRQPVKEAAKSDPSVFVMTEEVAKEYWKVKDQDVVEVHQAKVINLLDPPVMDDDRRERRRPQPTIVDRIAYTESIAPAVSRSEIVNTKKENAPNSEAFGINTEVENTAVSTALSSKPEPAKRERCSRSEVELPIIMEQIIPYSKVQKKPTFNGGSYNDFALWVGDNMCYPESLKQEVVGYVTVEITIGNDGSIGNVNIMSSPHKLLEKEVLYMLSTSPKWMPGAQGGKPVAVSVVIGIPVSAYL